MKTGSEQLSVRLERHFTVRVNHAATIVLFKKTVYLYLIINGLILLPVAPQIWGPDAFLIHYYPADSLAMKVLDVLSHPAVNRFYWCFLAGQLACCFAGLAGWGRRWSDLLLYFLTANMYFNVALIQNGGTNLMMVILFYMMFMNEQADRGRHPALRTLDVTATNFALLTAQIQVCVLYFVSTVYKVSGTHWLDGSAIYYVFNIDDYSTPWIQRHIANCDWLTVPATYATLGFQVLFPVTVWLKRLKPVTLAVGILFHLMVVLMIGFTVFGLIMIIMYLLFLSDSTSRRILRWFRQPVPAPA